MVKARPLNFEEERLATSTDHGYNAAIATAIPIAVLKYLGLPNTSLTSNEIFQDSSLMNIAWN
jgi:hypothetical protein